MTRQACAIHTSGVSQVITYRILEKWGPAGFDDHINQIQAFYREKRDTFVALLDTHLKEYATWHVPVAGMFVWIRLTGTDDTQALIMEKAKAKKVSRHIASFFERC